MPDGEQRLDEGMATLTEGDRLLEEKRSAPVFLFFATHDPHVPRVPHPRFAGTSGYGAARGRASAARRERQRDPEGARPPGAERQHPGPLHAATTAPSSTMDIGDEAVARLGGHKAVLMLVGKTACKGGTHVLHVRWPTRKAGLSGALVSQVDLLASLAGLLGEALAPGEAPDSEDVMAALLGTRLSAGRRSWSRPADSRCGTARGSTSSRAIGRRSRSKRTRRWVTPRYPSSTTSPRIRVRRATLPRRSPTGSGGCRDSWSRGEVLTIDAKSFLPELVVTAGCA